MHVYVSIKVKYGHLFAGFVARNFQVLGPPCLQHNQSSSTSTTVILRKHKVKPDVVVLQDLDTPLCFLLPW